ncbi:ComC/BlpC family leader-containing pheromone/bacteriocin [Lacticaseibacillus zeae]|uniref:ComC/BlpC family leader-containing pheromone/bacteriocin n=1 Tax=Lacticaseibacillus zeae TaxID=57037 RepID=A0A5R8M0U6_LACZE|nr:ComC/BlpC family leader-containing pheromone/bacteriocin [Lacticaseibacillus zeae]OLS11603.1 hypothetical protein AUQ39_00250 [Lacticaseibacillus casei]QVI31512.1 ComC/BlpC family leader-containing pheromone/bacteriocin [Lacticaseibacillus zeae]TLF39928.1 ComC/BlpC family leader-containing pheromone/bacteriocin [Lacticaseibacillus zeae]TLF41769.1 ComC/BlpC family leader-containing pheromone/bacteriocin [Lacticaseibacillus zeae]
MTKLNSEQFHALTQHTLEKVVGGNAFTKFDDLLWNKALIEPVRLPGKRYGLPIVHPILQES